ncbi:MAG: hypothetical protein MUP63_00685 [Candidatus Nanohaloarchaeota archaeon QJJ-7]|nr:hypothetical protein [Candidatus Nanohaloarchaeota archaeon QJJ-7]
MRYYSIALIIISISLAGCTSIPGQDDTSEEPQRSFEFTPKDGLTVSFSSLKSRYQNGEQMILEAEIENTGQATAENIEAQLFGASFISGNEYVGTLQGVDRAAEQPGERALPEWTPTADASLVSGGERSFDAGVEVSYKYSTTVAAPFTIVPREDFNGGNSEVSADNSASPVHASVDMTTPKPVIGDGGVEISVPVTIQNIGEGEVDSVNIDASLPNSDASVSRCGGDVPLYDDRREVICHVSLPSDLVVPETTLNLKMELGYTYTETTATTFKVEELPGG